MKARLFFAALATVSLAAATGETAAPEKLSLRVTPSVSSAPSDLIVQTTVAKNPDNRWLQIEADSGTFFRSSAIELDGDNAPAITEMRLSNLPSGNYTVVAMLKNNRGEETVVRRSVIVLSQFGEP
jgi:hypothetical protein